MLASKCSWGIPPAALAFVLLAADPATSQGSGAGQAVGPDTIILTACAEPVGKDCIRALLGRARDESVGISDPAVLAAAISAADRGELGAFTADERAMLDELRHRPDVLIADARFWTLFMIAYGYVQAGVPDQGNRLVPEMLDAWDLLVANGLIEPDSDFLSYVAGAQAGFGFFDDAFETVRHMATAEDKDGALANIAGSQAKAGFYDEALATVGRIEDDHDAGRALSGIAQAQADVVLFDAARATIGRIVSDSQRERATGDLASALARAGWYDHAFEDAERISDPHERAEALRDIARHQADAGSLKDAKATAERIERSSEKVSALLRIASIELAAGSINDGRNTLQGAAVAAADADLGGSWTELKEVEKAQSEAGFFEDAVATAQLFESGPLRDGALARIAVAQLDANLLGEAQATIERITDAGEKVWPLRQLALSQADSGQTETARNTLAAALEIELGKMESDNNASSLSSLAEAQAATGYFDDALMTAGKIEHEFYRSLALRHISEAQANARLFGPALQMASRIERTRQLAYAYVHIAAAQASAGLLDDAAGTFGMALNAAKQIDHGAGRDGVLDDVIVAHVDAGFIEEARRILIAAITEQEGARAGDDHTFGLGRRLLCPDASRWDALAWLSRLGFQGEALEIAERKVRACDRSWAYLSIAGGLLEDEEG